MQIEIFCNTKKDGNIAKINEVFGLNKEGLAFIWMLAVVIKKMTEITKSTIEDNEILTEITKKSKAYWGYSDEQMEIWSELLTITKNYIENNNVYKLLIDDLTVGYYSYIYLNEKEVKLDNLFVLPNYIGSGLGKLLMNNFLNRIKNTGIEKIILDSEPNAEKFYENFGFLKIGQIETSIKNRYLPIMELRT